ncbi:MAG: threonine--tRNA ligase [Candidatus Moranbacteria bacterium]|nr:threonine--tRNA ligase [Candidatus Moranbacteria bacterium]
MNQKTGKTKKSESNRETLRHSTAHVLAKAILELFPKTKVAIGPAIDHGFYYDFEFVKPIAQKDLPKIEKRMKKIINQNLKFKKKQISVQAALKLFKKLNQPYKVELIKELKRHEKVEKVTVYQLGDFQDLCRGPHLESTGKINAQAIKLTELAGAYWQGDEKNKMLTRIYGVVFATKAALKKHLEMLEQAKKRNHRKLGKELELFAIFPEIGQGLPVWLPNGYTIRRVLEDYMLKLEKSYGYEHILTPVINRKELFETSGHLEFYQDSMYTPLEIDRQTFYLKPMNCPAGMMVYKMKPRSYKDLPVKMGELGTVYRYEQSGELHGLQRVRGFTQNDAHIFCTPEQLEQEFMEVIELFEIFFKNVGFHEYKYRLSLRDEDSSKYVGDKDRWEWAQNVMRKVLKKNKVDFYEEPGEAAFYGPKIDVQAVNVFGKEDSIGTNQIDFNLPERFNLHYIDETGSKKQPFVIHRALIGSFERFFAFFIEHHAGAFPIWLSALQVMIIPVSDKYLSYAQKVAKKLKQEDIRVKIDSSAESLGKKIRTNQKQKIPYMLIVGDKEADQEKVAVRTRDQGDMGAIKLAKFIREIKAKLAKFQ